MNMTEWHTAMAQRGHPLTLPDESSSAELPALVRFGFGLLGWIAGVMVVAAILALISGALDSPIMLGVTGSALIGCSWWLYRQRQAMAFAQQLALSLSIAGQVLIAIALFVHFDTDNLVGARRALLLIAALQFGLSFWIQQPTHRTMTAWFGVLALLAWCHLDLITGDTPAAHLRTAAAVLEIGLLLLVTELALRPQLRFSRVGQMLGGLLLGVLCLRAHDWAALPAGLSLGMALSLPLSQAIPLLLGWLYVAVRTALHLKLSPAALGMAALLALLLALAARTMPGLLAAMAAALLAFHLRAYFLLGISLLVGLITVGANYYLLNWTLTDKGLALLTVGLTLLLACAVLNRWRLNGAAQ